MLTLRMLLAAVTVIYATSANELDEPFGGLATAPDVHGLLSATWRDLRLQLQFDQFMIESCPEVEAPTGYVCAAATALQHIVREATAQLSLRAAVGHINRAINLRIQPVPADWVSALDALEMGNGDCKAYAIAKYVALLNAGFGKVRLVIVHNARDNSTHMVTAVMIERRWLLLDNLTAVLVDDGDASRYRPLYVLDDNGARRYLGRGGSPRP